MTRPLEAAGRDQREVVVAALAASARVESDSSSCASDRIRW